MTTTAIAATAQTNIVAMPNGRSGFSLAPQSLDEALRFADILSKSSIVPKDYQGNSGNILVAIQWGAEIGLPPLQAMQNIAVINGRPAIWGDAVIALVKGSGLMERIQEDIAADQATCTVKRRGEAEVSRTFTMEDAKRAGLAGKQGPWTQYPKRMLQMRARAWALRDVFPDVLRGVHVGEEAQDLPSEPKNMGEVEQVAQPAIAPSRSDKVRAAIAHRKGAAQPVAALQDVLTAINQAQSADALKAAADLAAGLGDADKASARAAYADRKETLAREAAPVDQATGEISAPAPQEQDDFVAALG